MPDDPYRPTRARIRSLSLDELAAVKDQLPEDIKRGLILPLPPGTLPAEGTVGLPVVGYQMALARSGLAVPARPDPQPIDYFAMYMSAREHLGFEITTATIEEALALLPLRNVLWVLAQITQRADRMESPEEHVALARELLPPAYIDQAVNLLTSEQDPSRLTSSQVVLSLALRALVHCNPDWVDEEPHNEALVRQLGLLVLAMGDHVGTRLSSKEALALELVRGDLFLRTHGYLEWYIEAYWLFFHTLPAMGNDPRYFDVGDAVRSAYGIGLGDFWCLTALFGIASLRTDRPTVFTGEWGEARLDPTILERWLEAWSRPVDAAREAARNDLQEGSDWSFSAFRDPPIIQTNGRAHAVRSHYLAEKGGPVGMFWAIADALPPAIPYQRWSSLFGAMVHDRIHELLTEHVGDRNRLLSETAIEAMWGPGKVCDLLVLYPDAWVAIEYVFRNMSRPTQVAGTYDDLLDDLQKGVVEKIQQIDETLQRALAAGTLPPPARVYPVVVVGSSFPWNPAVARTVDEQLQTENLRVVTRDDRCRATRVLDLFELRSLLDIASQGTLLPDLLEEWVSSSLSDMSLRTWLDARSGPQPQWVRVDTEWEERARARLFHGAPEL